MRGTAVRGEAGEEVTGQVKLKSCVTKVGIYPKSNEEPCETT